MSSSRASSRAARFAAAFVLATVVMLLGATAAFAATTYSNPIPAPGSSVTVVNPAVRVTATDPIGINTTSLIFKLNGVKVNAKMSGSLITYQPASLKNGAYAASASVLNWAGVRSTYNWNFTVAANPVLGPLAPADGQTISSQTPAISAVVSPNGVALSSWSMTLDGVAVAATYDVFTKKVSYTPPAPLKNDEAHTATLSVTDASGASSTVTWTFSVQIYADMINSAACVDCHWDYPAVHPMTNCDNCHGYDGPIGGFYGAPDYHPEGEATLFLQDCTYCHSGTFPTVPMHGDLKVAHKTATDMSGCACHVRSLSIEHNRWTLESGQPIACTSCHGQTASQTVKDAIASGQTGCLSCHTISGSHPYGEIDHVADVGETADTSGFLCQDCHAMDLMTEHDKASSSSAGGQCATCHPQPRETFGAWTQTCAQGGCHAPATQQAVHGNETAAHAFADPNAGCLAAGCHGGPADLAAMHSSASAATSEGTLTSCLVCHAEGVPTTKDCATCHPDRVAEHGYVASLHTATLGSGGIELFGNHDGWMGPVGAYMNCDECHNNELGPIHADLCSTCHPVPRNSFTAWNKNCTQGGCHATYHASGFDHDEVASGNCGACHDEGSFSLYPDPCVDCHAKPNADTTPPVTTANVLAYYGGTARIYFDMSDSGLVGIGTTFHKIDGAAATRGDVLDITAPGPHTMEYWSVDQYGNEELPHKTATFTVGEDTTPPTTTSDVKAAYEGSATIRLAATDASYLGVKGTYYKLNNGATQTGTLISIAQPASGTVAYTLEYWSDDWAGNVETHHFTSFTVTRDTTPPVSTFGVQAYYKTSTVSIPFTATDTGSGVQIKYFRIDGGSLQSLSIAATNLTRTFTTQGPHTIEYWAVDRTGNIETHRTATFILDWTIPTVASNAVATYPETGADITVTANDLPPNGSGLAYIAYRIDGGAQVNSAPGAQSVSVNVTGAGSHSLEYWALDRAGNSSLHGVANFTVGSGGGTTGNGTIRLVWGDNDTSGYIPIPDSWASWTVRSGSSTGPIVATGYGDAGVNGWDGIDDVIVPVSATPYYVYIDWWDADWEYQGPTIFNNVYVTYPGQVVTLHY